MPLTVYQVKQRWKPVESIQKEIKAVLLCKLCTGCSQLKPCGQLHLASRLMTTSLNT